MAGNAVQDGMTVQGYGNVTSPPDPITVLTKIRAAVAFKQPLTLTSGELRVLVDLLDADQGGAA